MFDGKRINSLETSVTTLTEELEKANNTIEALFSNFEEVVEKLNDVQSENNKLKNEIKELNEILKEKDNKFANKLNKLFLEKEGLYKTCDDLKKSLNIYAGSVDKTIEEIEKKSEKDTDAFRNEIKNVADVVVKLEKKSNNADKEHDELLAVLKDSNEKLIKKCEELQLSNVQIMNEHRDMIKRYEEDIKAYQAQTQNMKNNILKKMNANNIISIVEE